MIKVVRRVLKVFADNGLFKEGVLLVGSWCFYFYQENLGAKKFPLRTLDVDFLIPNPFGGKEHLDFVMQLEDLGFNADFKRDGSLFLWNSELKVEFITPEKSYGSNQSIRIKKLGINAIPLRFVGLLLDKPMMINSGGLDIALPDPAHYCLHKLVIASRRRLAAKSLKDLQQAICTSAIVDEKAMKHLFSSLPRKWRVAIVAMLGKSKSELPLLKEQVEKLADTLDL